LNRSPDYLRDIARRNGYKWERHYGGRSDTKVFAYLAEHKNDDLVSLASALGYSDPRNLKNRLTKMRVPIPPMPPRAPGSGRIHVFDHEAIATLLVKGISHKQIAERIKCSLALVSVVARKHGVTRKKKQVTNEDILAYRRKHPKATHSQMAKALGYIFTKSLLSRLKKLGISLSQPKKRTK
jgi:hypothetical protein